MNSFYSLFYEVILETEDGSFDSKIFSSSNPIQSRNAALRYFLEEFYYAEVKPEETFVRVLVHHKSDVFELISSETFHLPEPCFKILEREFRAYQSERLAVHVALFNEERPERVTIIFPKTSQAQVLHKQTTHILLAQNYWLFLRLRKERFVFSNYQDFGVLRLN